MLLRNSYLTQALGSLCLEHLNWIQAGKQLQGDDQQNAVIANTSNPAYILILILILDLRLILISDSDSDSDF